MKIRPVTKLDKKNKITLKNYDDVMSKHCNIVVFFYGNLEQSGDRHRTHGL